MRQQDPTNWFLKEFLGPSLDVRWTRPTSDSRPPAVEVARNSQFAYHSTRTMVVVVFVVRERRGGGWLCKTNRMQRPPPLPLASISRIHCRWIGTEAVVLQWSRLHLRGHSNATNFHHQIKQIQVGRAVWNPVPFRASGQPVGIALHRWCPIDSSASPSWCLRFRALRVPSISVRGVSSRVQ